MARIPGLILFKSDFHWVGECEWVSLSYRRDSALKPPPNATGGRWGLCGGEGRAGPPGEEAGPGSLSHGAGPTPCLCRFCSLSALCGVQGGEGDRRPAASLTIGGEPPPSPLFGGSLRRALVGRNTDGRSAQCMAAGPSFAVRDPPPAPLPLSGGGDGYPPPLPEGDGG